VPRSIRKNPCYISAVIMTFELTSIRALRRVSRSFGVHASACFLPRAAHSGFGRDLRPAQRPEGPSQSCKASQLPFAVPHASSLPADVFQRSNDVSLTLSKLHKFLSVRQSDALTIISGGTASPPNLTRNFNPNRRCPSSFVLSPSVPPFILGLWPCSYSLPLRPSYKTPQPYTGVLRLRAFASLAWGNLLPPSA
jgi:hypothetical protein